MLCRTRIWLSSGANFDNTGLPYNASAILTDNIFDQAKYSQYSPLYMPITAALTWGAAFALYGGVLWGVLPGNPGISWEAHLFGFVGGLIAAAALHRTPARRPPRPPV